MSRVLIIDDSPFIAKEISTIIGDKGYEVVGHAKSGEAGIKMVEELNPDIITLDIIMPGIDGVEAAHEILKARPDQKIIMLSSLCDHDTLAEIKELGIKFLVPKPINAEELLHALEEV